MGTEEQEEVRGDRSVENVRRDKKQDDDGDDDAADDDYHNHADK